MTLRGVNPLRRSPVIERSYNGWIASPDPAKIGVEWYEVPTVPNRRFRTVKVAQPLFSYLIRRFNAEVDPLGGGVIDEWSYAYRKARAADALSCHASGTAVDLDATQFPMGRANMTPAQRKAVETILAACEKQYRWGGWFRMPYTDEMHFELVKGTSKASVEKAVRAMALHPDGRVLRLEDLGKDHPVRIRLLKKALARVDLYPKKPRYNGKWNPQLMVAWTAWRTRNARVPQARLDDLGAATNLF